MSVMDQDRRLRTALLPYQPRLLHEVLDSLDVAVVVLDETSVVLAGNVAAARLLGVRRGRRAEDVPPAAVVAITEECGAEVDVTAYDFWQARSGADALPVRVTYDDGTQRWLTATVQPLGDGDAVVCRYVDVTARRALERRARLAADHAARAEVDLVAAEQKVAVLEELLVYLATRGA